MITLTSLETGANRNTIVQLDILVTVSKGSHVCRAGDHDGAGRALPFVTTRTAADLGGNA
jgi:hypothetical protein